MVRVPTLLSMAKRKIAGLVVSLVVVVVVEVVDVMSLQVVSEVAEQD